MVPIGRDWEGESYSPPSTEKLDFFLDQIYNSEKASERSERSFSVGDVSRISR
jgi:hypothetical protein